MMKLSHQKQPAQASSVGELFSTVVNGGYCIGCGMCAALSPSVAMQMTAYGQWQPAFDRQSQSPAALNVAEVCPFADGNPNEDELGADLFPATAETHPATGRYLANYAGHVNQGGFREKGSSGGIATWILCQLLEEGHVDAVIHVGTSEGCDKADKELFRFVVSKSAAEVRARSKSRYYPVEMSDVVRHMLEHPGRYAVVGLPCFIKGLRLACRQSEVLRSRVAHTLGIVCGHLKSRAFADMLGWQLGVSPGSLQSIDFRSKRPDAPANDYAVAVVGEGAGGEVRASAPVASLFGTDWGLGLFKYKACDYCDDVLAETADVAVGDAWLPEYVGDSGGTSVVVVRTPFMKDLLERGRASGELQLDDLRPDRIAQSQDAGLRHRREGLAFRLAEAEAAGIWAPSKRVKANRDHLSAKQQRIFALRQRCAEFSHQAFRAARQAGDFSYFKKQMQPLLNEYARLYRPGILRLLGLKWQSASKKLASALGRTRPGR